MAPKHKKKAGHKKKDDRSKTLESKAKSKGRVYKAEKADKGSFKSDSVMPPLIDEDDEDKEDG